MSQELDKVFQANVVSVADGDSSVVDARGCAVLTVIAGTGCTATVTRIDSADQASASDDHGTENEFTVSANSATVTPVDWPWYRVSASGGTCRAARL